MLYVIQTSDSESVGPISVASASPGNWFKKMQHLGPIPDNQKVGRGPAICILSRPAVDYDRGKSLI